MSARLPEENQKQAQKIINVPLPDTVIYHEDLLWLVGADDDLAKLPEK